jgi:hypothetical protein
VNFLCFVFFGGDVEVWRVHINLSKVDRFFGCPRTSAHQNFCTPTKTTKTQKIWQEIEDKQSKQAHKRSEPGSTQIVLRSRNGWDLLGGKGRRGLNQENWMIVLDENRWRCWMWRWITAGGTIKKKEKEKWWMDETCMGEGKEPGGD